MTAEEIGKLAELKAEFDALDMKERRLAKQRKRVEQRLKEAVRAFYEAERDIGTRKWKIRTEMYAIQKKDETERLGAEAKSIAARHRLLWQRWLQIKKTDRYCRYLDALRNRYWHSLKERHLLVLSLRAKGMVFREIGAVIGTTPGRARDIYENANSRLIGLRRSEKQERAEAREILSRPSESAPETYQGQ